jgi:peptidyl-prolyl cis-trans isomerase B (cyclophilin B)
MLAVLAPRTTPALPARAALAVLAGLLVLAACGSAAQASRATARGPAAPSGCRTVSRPSLGARTARKPAALLASSKHYDVTLVTNCGSFTFRIDQAESPHAAAAFVALVQHGFFNRTIFHRIVPGFVIQGGDPTGTGGGGPGFTTIDTPPANAAYTDGVVAMAKTGAQPPGAAGSQFFVVTEPNAGLPPDYAIIGRVTRGLAVVDRIGTLGNAAQQPTMVVEIEQARVTVSG